MPLRLSAPPWPRSPQPYPIPVPLPHLPEGSSSMSSTGNVILSNQANTREMSESAFAMFDEHGTVVAWTQAAERLVGYSAGDVVGRSAALVLPLSEEAPTISAFVEQCRTQSGWSNATAVRRQDGRMLDINLRISTLWGQDGTVRWLISVTDTDTLSRQAMNGSVRESLLTRAPIGIAVRDPQLLCTWVNDTMGCHDGISRDRRLGRRFTDVLPGVKTEALEAVMRQVLHSGTTKVHQYRMWPPTSPRQEHKMAASFFCLLGADGQALGVCSINVDITESRQARERLAILSEASTRLGRTLDVMQTGQELADLAVPLLADFAAVDLEQSVSFGEGPRSASARRTGASPCSDVPVWHPSTKGSRNRLGRAVTGSTGPPPHPSPMSCAPGGPTWSRSWTPLRARGSMRTRYGRRRSASTACTP